MDQCCTIIAGWLKPPEMDGSAYKAGILMTFSCVWRDVFTASDSVGWLTHTEWSWYDRLWSPPLCLSLLQFPQWTFTYVDPHPPWKIRMKIHEMKCQIPGFSLWHRKWIVCSGKRTKNEYIKKRRGKPKHWTWWGVRDLHLLSKLMQY